MDSVILKLALCVILIAVTYKLMYFKNENNVRRAHKEDHRSNEDLLKQEYILDHNAQIINVTEHVYVGVGYGIGNMMMIEGKDK